MSNVVEAVNKKESLIKGRIAESLVKELFSALNMEVYPYGIEYNFPHLAHLHKNGEIEQNIALKHVANQPDFIICNPQEGKERLYRVEVKFRASGKIHLKELLSYDDDVVFVFLDLETFYIFKRSKLETQRKSQGELHFKDMKRLSQGTVFNLGPAQKKMVFEFSKYVGKYLGSPNLMGAITEKDMPLGKKGSILKRIMKRFAK